MNKSGFESGEDELESRMTIYRDLITDDDIRQTTWKMAQEMRSPEDPVLVLADLETARRYLQKIITTADFLEIYNMEPPEFCAMWAKGTLGAARHRAGNAGGGRRARHG